MCSVQSPLTGSFPFLASAPCYLFHGCTRFSSLQHWLQDAICAMPVLAPSIAFASSATIPSIQLSQMPFLSTHGLPLPPGQPDSQGKGHAAGFPVSFSPITLTAKAAIQPRAQLALHVGRIGLLLGVAFVGGLILHMT